MTSTYASTDHIDVHLSLADAVDADVADDHVLPLHPTRLQRAKKAYTTRFLAERLEEDSQGYSLRVDPGVAPRPGDVALARVVELGKRKRLETPHSRRASLFVGDEILVAYGHRYAPDQFEAEVPADLGTAHLIAAGGIIGRVTAQHASIDFATVLEPIGLLADGDGVVNLSRVAPLSVVDPPSADARRADSAGPTVIAVLGTSMNSGKSTTLANLVHGLTKSGLTVAAGKATGTGAGGDPRLFTDAGASKVLDFTDFGHPSTFRLAHTTVRALLSSMVDELNEAGTDVVVIEIADGVYQSETSRLLRDPLFDGLVDKVVFAAADALGAGAGVRLLQEAGHEVIALSGVVTASPLAAREAAAVVDVPVVDTFDLAQADVANRLLA
ncbi:hypothetical protein [Nocardioides jensenii]|uniref:hypothetical protein n=1 Tax=Nocardioides jensenii TaxID=1843 RepID=UPI000A9DBA3A|nr:hypothetical protein [Nocardioides jensenii]